MTFEEACQAIVDAGKDPKQVNQVNYAVGYAREGLRINDMAKDTGWDGSDALRVQALYILGNITRWRGDKAKEVRAFLKAFSK